MKSDRLYRALYIGLWKAILIVRAVAQGVWLFVDVFVQAGEEVDLAEA